MVFGINPKVLEQAKQIGEHYTMEVVKNCQDGKIDIRLIPKDDWSKSQLPAFVDLLVNQLCSHFYTFLGIQGEIIVER